MYKKSASPFLRMRLFVFNLFLIVVFSLSMSACIAIQIVFPSDIDSVHKRQSRYRQINIADHTFGEQSLGSLQEWLMGTYQVDKYICVYIRSHSLYFSSINASMPFSSAGTDEPPLAERVFTKSIAFSILSLSAFAFFLFAATLLLKGLARLCF